MCGKEDATRSEVLDRADSSGGGLAEGRKEREKITVPMLQYH